MSVPDTVLAVFSKAPVAGHVNTRLIPYISAEAAAELHHQLLHDRLQMACAMRSADVHLWCSPDTTHPAFRACAGKYPITLHEQTGDDLGIRMVNALRTMLAGYRKAIIIGTDAPALREPGVNAAISALESHDFVLTPAEDGGYVLIGATRDAGDVLIDIPWGTSGVLHRTCKRLDRLGYRYALMEPCWDIDRPGDLERYREMRKQLKPDAGLD